MKSAEYVEKQVEKLKKTDQMKWVQMMNSLKTSAEEIVLSQLVYN